MRTTGRIVTGWRGRLACGLMAGVTALAACGCGCGWPQVPEPAGEFTATRLTKEPILHKGMFSDPAEAWSINGPWLVRVPEWVDKPLGKYYLYFAHHMGKYIRMAYADDLAGPWTLYKPGAGVLHESQQTAMVGHVASPCVLVDEANKRFVMFYHGSATNREEIPAAMRSTVTVQCTAAATSKDGLNFTPVNRIVSDFYLYPFEHEGTWYGMARMRNWWRTKDLLGVWEMGPQALEAQARATEPSIAGTPKYAQIRHVGFLKEGKDLTVLFSCTGGYPERIYQVPVRLEGDWRTWQASGPAAPLLRPELPWEGAGSPMQRSLSGVSSIELFPALQDPSVFTDRNGRRYLLYSGGGEKAIGIAELKRRVPAGPGGR